MNFLQTTQHYFSLWAGTDLSRVPKGAVTTVECAKRDRTQFGYDKPFDLLLFVFPDRLVLSYGTRAAGRLDLLTGALTPTLPLEGLSECLCRIYEKQPRISVKYTYTDAGAQPASSPQAGQPSEAVTLQPQDFADYLQFFTTVFPHLTEAEDGEWLHTSFLRGVEKGCCCACYQHGRIVSLTDAPGTPYLSDCTQEVGVNTLPEYRRRGFARQACTLALQNLVQNGYCPLWSTDKTNITSQQLALRLGFIPYLHTLSLTL
ncbi:MAG: GNAT family N-acetyltransferase [Eubacteriales bacterium]